MLTLPLLSDAIATLVESRQAAVFELIGARIPASATLWSADGLAVTVAHAMGDNDQGAVRLADGREVQATVLGRDPAHDLALLQLELPADFDVAAALSPPAEASPRTGELTLTLARTHGRVHASLAAIASIGPAWRSRLGAQLSVEVDVDTSLARGASGGPLIDTRGQLVGINTHGLLRGGTTVAVADVRVAVEAIQRHGDRRPGFLGVRFSPARLSGHPSRKRGLLVTAVGPSSPAAQAGIAVGDLILQVDGQEIRRGDDLLAALATRAEQLTRVDLWRAGEAHELEVRPVARRFGRHHRGGPRGRTGPKVAPRRDEGPGARDN